MGIGEKKRWDCEKLRWFCELKPLLFLGALGEDVGPVEVRHPKEVPLISILQTQAVLPFVGVTPTDRCAKAQRHGLWGLEFAGSQRVRTVGGVPEQEVGQWVTHGPFQRLARAAMIYKRRNVTASDALWNYCTRNDTKNT